MSESTLTGQYEEVYENLIQGLLNQGFGISHLLLNENIISDLRRNLLAHRAAGTMHSAGIGRQSDFQTNSAVRGDVIKWIDNNPVDLAERALMARIQDFIDYLNRTCFTSINDFEFHYACYEPGSHYLRHLDQFKSESGRKFSLVIYLNDNWNESDGGHLSLYAASGTTTIYPEGGRVVFFKSDEVEHEVHAAPFRARLSIAGWLKSV